jgi:threonine/homoserine/homoserine lactone efflux protein
LDTLLTATQFAGFLTASILITLAPGPDNLMVLSLGIARGRRAGMIFGLGCALGCINHTVLAALGVSALIAASPTTFTALKLAGGLYLIWLGVQAIRSARPLDSANTNDMPKENSGRLFAKGLIANSINPKVVLFFLAFLPQFVDSTAGHSGWQIIQLGLVFTVQAALIFSLIGWFSGAIGERIARRPAMAMWLDRLAGGIFIALGAKLLAAQ